MESGGLRAWAWPTLHSAQRAPELADEVDRPSTIDPQTTGPVLSAAFVPHLMTHQRSLTQEAVEGAAGTVFAELGKYKNWLKASGLEWP